SVAGRQGSAVCADGEGGAGGAGGAGRTMTAGAAFNVQLDACTDRRTARRSFALLALCFLSWLLSLGVRDGPAQARLHLHPGVPSSKLEQRQRRDARPPERNAFHARSRRRLKALRSRATNEPTRERRCSHAFAPSR